MVVYIVSDIHRDIQSVKEQVREVGKENIDLIISAGDDSLNYFGGKKDQGVKAGLNGVGVEILLVRGNHDKRPEKIKSYKEENYRGGLVYVEEKYPNLKYAKTGEVYDVQGYKVLAIGGGYSIDKHIRKATGMMYVEDEQPTEEEKKRVEERLKEERVDYIISHVAPKRYEPVELFLPNYSQDYVDKATEEWLDKIYEVYGKGLKKWYFGHYHGNKVIDNVRLVYKNFIEMGR